MPQQLDQDVSYARLDVFTRGMVWGMYLAGATREDMLKHIVKTDGSTPNPSGLDDIIANRKEDPTWTDESSNVGRP